MEGEKKGIFWIVDRENLQSNEPYLFCIPVDRMGAPIAGAPIPPLNSKHGDNYKHKKTWEEYLPAALRRGKPYNFYPRGRVEIKDAQNAIVFLNPVLAAEDVVAYLKEQFCLENRVLKIVADGSAHYRCMEEAEPDAG